MSELNVSNLGGYISPSFKNKIINGDFNIWQRGISFVSPANATFVCDRFRYNKGGAGATMFHTVSRDTDVPTLAQSNHKSNYSLKVDCTTADAVLPNDGNAWMRYAVEGYDYTNLSGKTCTLSFWVKATKTGTYCTAFVNSGSDRSYITEYIVNSSDTWEKKEVSVKFDETGGTWDYTNGVGIAISFTLASGSTFQTTKDSWQSGSYLATSNQVNACDNVANNFWLSQVQFEVGSSPTQFENRSFDADLFLCQRYYEKSYDIDVDPGTITYTGAKIMALSTATNNINEMIDFFKVQKRSIPTIVWYSPITLNKNGFIRDYTAPSADVAVTSTTWGSEGKTGRPNLGGNRGDQHLIGANWTADSEL